MAEKNNKHIFFMIAKGNGEIVAKMAKERGITKKQLFMDAVNYKVMKDREAEKAKSKEGKK